MQWPAWDGGCDSLAFHIAMVGLEDCSDRTAYGTEAVLDGPHAEAAAYAFDAFCTLRATPAGSVHHGDEVSIDESHLTNAECFQAGAVLLDTLPFRVAPEGQHLRSSFRTRAGFDMGLDPSAACRSGDERILPWLRRFFTRLVALTGMKDLSLHDRLRKSLLGADPVRVVRDLLAFGHLPGDFGRIEGRMLTVQEAKLVCSLGNDAGREVCWRLVAAACSQG